MQTNFCLLFNVLESYLSLAGETELKKPMSSSAMVCFASGLFWTLIDCFLLKSQVEDVNAKFAALEKLKDNNWKEEEKKTRKVTRKSKVKVLIVASYANILNCVMVSFVTVTCQ